MAIRMQQRRGTAQQWTDANPVLGAGEIGFETDTNKFKVGDGLNNWNTLTYFTSKEYADTLVADSLTAHADTTENVHGIADTAELVTMTNLNNHNSDTTDVHGIPDTSVLVTTTDLNGHSADTTNVHGIADTAQLATLDNVSNALDDAASDATTKANAAQAAAEGTAADALSSHNLDTTNVHGISDTSVLVTTTDLALKAPIAGPTFTGTVVLPSTTSIGNVSATEIGYLDGVTSGVQTQLDSKLSTSTASSTYAPKADPSLTGTATVENITVTGNLTVQGTTTTVDTTNLEVTDSLIYLSAEQYDTDALDIGIFGAYGDVNAGHFHTGLVRDASDGKWKLISNGPEPVSNEVNFTSVNYDTLKVGGVEFSDGTQTKEGVVSRTPIIQKSASYTLSALSERDSLIEMGSSSALTLTIPANSAVAYPVGTSIDILQTSTGQVTIAGAGGVTVNATPGLKLRTQWSGVTLFKRATDTWVVYGDLSA
jgi:hypothetical protein